VKAGAADLEIGIHRRDGQTYLVETRLQLPGADQEVRPPSGAIALDLDALRSEAADDRYGALLGQALLGDADVRAAFATALVHADAAGNALRVRLLIGPTASELHSLRWETLRDPQTKKTLFTGENLLFSRYVSSSDGRPLRRKSTLRAFAFVANPNDAKERYGLAPVRVADELANIQSAFGAAVHSLPLGEPATLNALLGVLRDGFDVLYLVAHGKLIKGEPKIYLETDDGSADVVSGSDLVARLSDLRLRPRLVVLGSCQSAGTADYPAAEGYMTALGPRLADSGIPAVVAMQGSVSMETEARFMASFFKSLQRDGVADLAMSVARTEVLVAKRPDWWMPVLFMRQKSGRVWYEPGFVLDGKTSFEKWKAICAQVLKGEFVPIVGPELGEDVFGSSRELARQLADSHGFPLAAHERTDLAKVTQYISTTQDRKYVQGAVEKRQREILRRVEADRLGGVPGPDGQSLSDLIKQAAERCHASREHPYRSLADLGASIYLNASYDTTLFHALKAGGREPEAVFAAWRGADVPKRPEPKSISPEPGTPWVYHVFGRYGKPDTMVLTEDDFFDYLIATSRLDLLLPALVRRLMQSSLLFLGFRLDDWRFRVLFRMIVTRPGTNTMMNLSHVGVQVNPDEHSLADVERARKYMESYFRGGKSAPEISIYWGTAAEFLQELNHHLAQMREEEPAAVVPTGDDDYL
jgi:CHAT domain/SIR2-like domain